MAVKRDREKLKTLVHYVIDRCDNPAILGSIKLNKVLWLADLAAYMNTGTPLTGERYVKQQFGPVAHSMVGILKELQDEGKIAIRECPQKTEYFSLMKPEHISKAVTADEISLVERARDFVCDHRAHEISEMTHDIIWELAEIGEEIPYEAVFASRLDGVTKEDVTWARKAHDAALVK